MDVGASCIQGVEEDSGWIGGMLSISGMDIDNICLTTRVLCHVRVDFFLIMPHFIYVFAGTYSFFGLFTYIWVF